MDGEQKLMQSIVTILFERDIAFLYRVSNLSEPHPDTQTIPDVRRNISME
jgi:hypothetical protein